MPMLRLAPRQSGRDAVTVDVDGKVGLPVPRVENDLRQSCFLDGLAKGRNVERLRSLVVTARLEPASEGAVVNEQGVPPRLVENEG